MKFTVARQVETQLTLQYETDDFLAALEFATREAQHTIGPVQYWLLEEILPGKRMTLGHTDRDAEGLVRVHWTTRGLTISRTHQEAPCVSVPGFR